MRGRTGWCCWALVLMAGVSPGVGAVGESPNVTFFAWSDQHVKSDGDASHLTAAIEAMGALPGRPFPSEIGGAVPKPDLILGCGDCTDWPTRPAVRAYDRAVKSLSAPAYDIMGNHDEGQAGAPTRLLDSFALMAAGVTALALLQLAFLLSGLHSSLRGQRGVRLCLAMAIGAIAGWVVFAAAASGNDAMEQWIVSRHGALSYSFDRGGVHFVMVFSRYTSPERISDEALQFIRRDLANVAKGTLVVVASHYCFESIHNRDALIDSFGDANVVLVLGGHFHQATANEYRGVQFVQIPSARYAQQFSVVRVIGSKIAIAVWDARRGDWAARSCLIGAMKNFY